MAAHRASEYDVILGKLVCDRLGLDPNRVLREGLSIEDVNGTQVMVTLNSFAFLPREEMAELRAIAHHRYLQGGGGPAPSGSAAYFPDGPIG